MGTKLKELVLGDLVEEPLLIVSVVRVDRANHGLALDTIREPSVGVPQELDQRCIVHEALLMEALQDATVIPLPDHVSFEIVPFVLQPLRHRKTVFFGPNRDSTGVDSSTRDASYHIPLEVVRITLVHKAIDGTSLIGTLGTTSIQG